MVPEHAEKLWHNYKRFPTEAAFYMGTQELTFQVWSVIGREFYTGDQSG